jgi:hypothetical protein
MKSSKLITLIICIISSSMILGDVDTMNKKDNAQEIAKLSREDTFPKESITGMSDAYLEGYLQSLVDMHYYEYKVIVLVNDHKVWIANLPKNKLLANSITSFLKDVPGIDDVQVINGLAPKEMERREKYLNRPKVSGIWFPQNTELFQPLIANPRQAIYSAGYRGGDQVIGKNVAAVSLGDDFPIYRWLNVFKWKGDLQIGIEGGIWSVFNLDPHPNIISGTELVNTDFYVGFPITYAVNNWSYKLRYYHISSHLGDEFLENNPGYVRVNPSFEAIDLFASYQVNEAIRLYIGPGFVIRSDKSYKWKPFYLHYGAEFRFGGYKSLYQRLYGTWLFSVFFRTEQELHYNFDGTAIFGYEWSKLQGVGRKIRLFAEGHHGYSFEGQFSKDKTTYWAIKFAYGF